MSTATQVVSHSVQKEQMHTYEYKNKTISRLNLRNLPLSNQRTMALDERNTPLNLRYEDSHWPVRAKAFFYWSVLKDHTAGWGT